ncbi:LuxR C-terminal-related transcriptional regulator [Herbiconiux sp. UC225_62]|uniref:LuxR C-terminal-related transcriptional regulator n=1 Tax=Herbiconiux sp. UC225_62 TaxID=3350168 RepID=UPI0036D2632A
MAYPNAPVIDVFGGLVAQQQEQIRVSGVRPRSVAGQVIDRPRMTAASDALRGAEVRALAVWSGAGTGKTTLLDQWTRELRDTGLSVARLTGDDLAGQVEELTAHLGDHIIVVDDFHLVPADIADALFDSLPSHDRLRLIVAGRFQPGSSLSHLAATGLLLELRTDDLAFTTDECNELAASHGVMLPPAAIDSLTNRTGGWSTGLVLVLPLLAASPDPAAQLEHFVGDNRAIGDYLASEVLGMCSAREQSLLLTAAVDGRVPLELIAELTRDTGAGLILDTLSRRLQLLSITTGEVTFHPVLLNFLQAEARNRDLRTARLSHQHAARWFARRGDGQEALQHAAASGDVNLLKSVIGTFAIDLILTGHSAPVLAAIHALPSADQGLAEHTSQLLISIPFADRYASARTFRLADAADRDSADTGWSTLLTALHVLAATTASETAPYRTRLDSPVSTIAREKCFGLDLLCIAAEGWVQKLSGSTRAAIDCFHHVADSAHTAGYVWLALQVSVFAADAASADGSWEEAALIEDTMTDRAQQFSRSLIDRARAAATVVAASRQYQRCLPLPADELTGIVETDSASGSLGLRAPARALQLLEALDSGDPREAADELDDLLRASGRGYPRLVAASLLRLTSIRLELDGRSAARDFAAFAEPLLGSTSLELQLARYLLDPAVRATDDREQRLLSATTAGLKSWHAGAMVGAWLLLAAHAQATGKRVEADRRITAAAAHAKRFRTIRPFRARHDEGATLLASRSGHFGHLEEFAQLVIRRIGAYSPVQADSPLSVRLTSREHDILRELPAHQSLAEIARRQHLSANTVKTHVRAIYQKLGVTERSAAVSAAQRLNLL